MSNLRFLNPPTLVSPPGFTQVVEATAPGRIIYIAGQVGIGPDGKLAGEPGDFRAQARQTFENLRNALAAVGAGFDSLVKVNVYLTDCASQLPVYREVRDAYVNTAAPPASTLVQVSKLALDALLIEVEATAILPPK